MRDGGNLVFVYDGSFDGLLTAVYEAYYRMWPGRVLSQKSLQQSMDERYLFVGCDLEKSEKVYAAARKKLGSEGLEKVYKASLSHDAERATHILRYLELGFEVGRDVHRMLTHPAVHQVEALIRFVNNELLKLMGFVRFSRLEQHIYYAPITPRNDALPLLMPHFADRMDVPFILHDKGREYAGVYDLHEWVIVSAEAMKLPEMHTDEVEFRKLWNQFYNTIAVEGRINPKLRRQLMPKRYWGNMTEVSCLTE